MDNSGDINPISVMKFSEDSIELENGAKILYENVIGVFLNKYYTGGKYFPWGLIIVFEYKDSGVSKSAVIYPPLTTKNDAGDVYHIKSNFDSGDIAHTLNTLLVDKLDEDVVHLITGKDVISSKIDFYPGEEEHSWKVFSFQFQKFVLDH